MAPQRRKFPPSLSSEAQADFEKLIAMANFYDRIVVKHDA
jgi:hypothetical protein